VSCGWRGGGARAPAEMIKSLTLPFFYLFQQAKKVATPKPKPTPKPAAKPTPVAVRDE